MSDLVESTVGEGSQLPAGKKVSTVAANIVGIRHQETTGEDSRLRGLCTCCSKLQNV
jgi:hypothetical protein